MAGEVTVQAVIARADQALYRAKDDGRNCVRIAAETATLIADETQRHNRVGERSSPFSDAPCPSKYQYRRDDEARRERLVEKQRAQSYRDHRIDVRVERDQLQRQMLDRVDVR